MDENPVLVEREPPIALVTLNREDRLNALDNRTTRILHDAIESLAKDPSIRTIIITGRGRAFCAGSDIHEYNKMEKVVEYMEHQKLGRMVYDLIENLEKPVIAAVNGYCLGGGLELALVCDVIVASDNAKFGDPTLRLGVIPGGGTTQRLTRIIGRNMVKELLFTGEFIRAEEARQLGLVNKVVAAEKLIEESKNMAVKVAKMAPLALAKAKKLVNEGTEAPLNVSLSYEIEATVALFGTEDRVEGMKAFIEKREPNFKGV